MLNIYKRTRKGKDGQNYVLMSLTHGDKELIEVIENQKRRVKGGEQETYDLAPFDLYLQTLERIAKLSNAITAPPSQYPYNLAIALGKELSRRTGVDFVTCFSPTGKTRRHITQKFNAYDSEIYRVKIPVTGLTILLLDDVIYTGYTLIESKKALEALGNFIMPIAIIYT